jgi:membrane protease YdiL (CAAX protease family)
LSIPSGLWIGNLIAGIVGVVFGAWAIQQTQTLFFTHWKRDLALGFAVGLLLVLLTQLASRALILRIPFARQELARLYSLLETPPGPVISTPILLLVVLAEELVFRGAVTTALARRFSSTLPAVISTTLYTIPLLASGSWLLPLVGITLGSVWTVLRQRSQGLTASLISHAMFSVATFVWLPIR